MKLVLVLLILAVVCATTTLVRSIWFWISRWFISVSCTINSEGYLISPILNLNMSDIGNKLWLQIYSQLIPFYFSRRRVTGLTHLVPGTMVVRAAVVEECIVKRMIPLGQMDVVVSYENLLIWFKWLGPKSSYDYICEII